MVLVRAGIVEHQHAGTARVLEPTACSSEGHDKAVIAQPIKGG